VKLNKTKLISFLSIILFSFYGLIAVDVKEVKIEKIESYLTPQEHLDLYKPLTKLDVLLETGFLSEAEYQKLESKVWAGKLKELLIDWSDIYPTYLNLMQKYRDKNVVDLQELQSVLNALLEQRSSLIKDKKLKTVRVFDLLINNLRRIQLEQELSFEYREVMAKHVALVSDSDYQDLSVKSKLSPIFNRYQDVVNKYFQAKNQERLSSKIIISLFELKKELSNRNNFEAVSFLGMENKQLVSLKVAVTKKSKRICFVLTNMISILETILANLNKTQELQTTKTTGFIVPQIITKLLNSDVANGFVKALLANISR